LSDFAAGFLFVDCFGDLSPMVRSLIGNPDGSVERTVRADRARRGMVTSPAR